MRDMEKALECEIVRLNKFYKSEFIHFLIRCIFFVLIKKKKTLF